MADGTRDSSQSGQLTCVHLHALYLTHTDFATCVFVMVRLEVFSNVVRSYLSLFFLNVLHGYTSAAFGFRQLMRLLCLILLIAMSMRDSIWSSTASQ